ncbi:MAG: hypothetical protein ACRENE_20135, partial [Polyangiaceae bacterium]
MSPGQLWLILLVCTASTTCAAVGFALFIARRRAILAIPDNRSSHSVPTPAGGGGGILFAMILVLVAFRIGGPCRAWLE